MSFTFMICLFYYTQIDDVVQLNCTIQNMGAPKKFFANPIFKNYCNYTRDLPGVALVITGIMHGDFSAKQQPINAMILLRALYRV